MTKVATGFVDDDDDDDGKRDKPNLGLNGKAPEGREKDEPKPRPEVPDELITPRPKVPDELITPQPEVADELITPRQFAQLLKVSLRTLWRLVSTGKTPRPLKLLGSTRWQKSVVTKWIQGGCRPQ